MDVRSSLWDSGRDEEVQVNQRALIDKVLARYSGEHTVLRELLQNADDAGAKNVEIHFKTRAFSESAKEHSGVTAKSSATTSTAATEAASSNRSKLPDLTKELLHQWEFKNDGVPFREEDWNRLKKIAEGNPDEQKIGAFGVGFYSLFSVTDEPFVTSGGQWMGFYWKDNKDQLFARRGALPPSNTSASMDPNPKVNPWTSFVMPLREPSTFPARPVDISRFLATSLTFTSSLRGVSLFFNEHRLAHLTKGTGSSKNLPLPSNLDSTSKPLGIMHVKTINSIDLHIQAKVLRWTYHTGTEKPKVPARLVITKPAAATGGGFFASLFGSMAGTRAPEPITATPPAAAPNEPDLLEIVESSVGMTVYAARVDVKLDKKFLTELERATKKQPPATCIYSLIYTGKDEYDASRDEDERNFKTTGGVFQGLRADLDRAGTSRVFIGHATSQSTGIGGHVSARFIPTVERESIDFVDRNVSKWNKELLYVGGYLARAVYEYQLSSIKTLWEEASKSTAPPSDDIDETLRLWLEGKCLHALRFFTFYNTTPSAVVGTDTEAAFFSCGKPLQQGEFPILSTSGVKASAQVRAWEPQMRLFLKKVPMLPEGIANGAPSMISFLREWGMVLPVNFQDVIAELSDRALAEEEMLECLKWRMSSQPNQPNVSTAHEQFVQAAVFSVRGADGVDRVVPLSTIKTFLSPGNIVPPTCPLPQHTLPFELGKHFKPDQLRQFFGWTDLNVVQWAEYLVSEEMLSSSDIEKNVTKSPVFSERVFIILARAWGSLPNKQMQQIAELLRGVTVIPTKTGMRKPAEAYFSNANVFPDLPTVMFPGAVIKGNLEKLLVALGVMKHVELQIIFDRMINTGDWGVQELVKYLVAVRTTLTPVEMTKLQHTAAFPRESPEDSSKHIDRRKPSALYEPTDALRDLGLPILDWGTQHKWRPASEEAKFLRELGLQSFPSLATVLALAAGPDLDLRRKALTYLLENFTARYAATYHVSDYMNLAYIPSLRSDGTAFLAKHGEVFLNPECALLGFSLVEPSLRADALSKLQVAKDPPTNLIMPVLAKSAPQNESLAQQWFEYLTGRIADFTGEQFAQLREMAIVPASSAAVGAAPASRKATMYKPGECFFRNERNSSTVVHSNLFTFIDFGGKANVFLRACGVKNEPSVPEVAASLLNDPKRFLELAGGPRGYLDELRQIAAHQNFQPALIQQMKRTPFLLGSRRTPRPVTDKHGLAIGEEEGEEEDYDITYDLLRPDQIIVVDDTNAYSLFSEALYGAPQEDLLEGFYMFIGSPRLSSLTAEEYQPRQIENQPSRLATETRALILQRFPLFLHERNAPCRFRPDWLATGNNFQVRGCGKLNLVRTLNFGGKRLTKVQEASAAAELATRFGSSGPLSLFISTQDKLDMYEVAHSICKLLLKNHKVNDSLLFMTILSTDLRALRRRGFNVDRIIHQQKVEQRLMAAQRVAEEQSLAQMPGADPFQPAPAPSLPPPLNEKARLPPPPGGLRGAKAAAIPRASSPPPQSAVRPPSPDGRTIASSRSKTVASNALNSLKDRFIRKGGIPNGFPSLPGSDSTLAGAGASSSAPRGDEEARVTPTNDIDRNIRTAIAACRAEKSSVVANRQQMTTVKESLDDGYCDISGADNDFSLISTVDGYRFYVAKDVPSPQQTMASKLPALTRFASAIIKPLAQVYKLPSTSIHIFYDLHGGLIAFNRNGSLFLNLRYYESWHDAEVQENQTHKALISWYHSLAHEIAHNLVHPHNAEHEFYFSAICESHLMDLVRILAAA